MHNKRAFTLIELLVVLAIFAILISILVPVSIKAIEMGNRAKCVNNLKALGVAYLAYASDHNGELPHFNELPTKIGESFSEPGFADIVEIVYTNGYVTDLRLYICPSDKVDYGNAPVSPAKSIWEFNGDGNCSYMYISGYHLMRTLETPAVAPLLCDESNKRENGAATPGAMPHIGPDDNHGANIRNVLFLDGHVVTFKDANAANAIFDSLRHPEMICSVD